MGERAVDDGRMPATLAGGRYRVASVLGRGGMATVYAVADRCTGRTVALKQLTDPGEHRLGREIELGFQREFHTLSQLSHPRVIEVYDYGVDAGLPYYTMELLAGGDLRSRAPMPWKEACAALVDVCSCLSLLHSRRLVHRDVSPRNIRCTASGRAKLIDFGALIPSGSAGHVVGTPPFVAPEVLYRSTLDARTDLFSLGATLYYTLTRKHAFPVRDFAGLPEAWRSQPRPPSALVPEIPTALDALVMSLLEVDPPARPRSAYEVMERLSTLAGLERPEAGEVAEAYLFAPRLVGRDAALAVLREHLERAVSGHGSGVWIGPGAGIGRTRMLDECALLGKAVGATVVRAGADTAGKAPLSTAHALVAQLSETADETSRVRVSQPPPVEVPSDTPQSERACQQLVEAILAATDHGPLLIAVDDVERIDDASVVVLATLSELAPDAPLMLAVTHAGSDTPDETFAPALALMRRHCHRVALSVLDAKQTHDLVTSVFGDVPNVAWLSQRLHAVSGGHPRELMDLLSHLCESGAISYADGLWVVPAQLAEDALPRDAEQAFIRRLERLSPLARVLAQTQALASHQAFTRKDYEDLDPEREAQAVEAALADLVAHGVLVGNEWVYSLARPDYAQAVVADLDAPALAKRHAALARLYEVREPDDLPVIYHLLEAGQEEAAVEKLALYAQDFEARGLAPVSQTSAKTLVGLVERAFEVVERRENAARNLNDLRRAMLLLSVTNSTRLYHKARGPLLAQLRVDSGLDAYEQLSEDLDPAERLQQALNATMARHAALPGEEQVYRVDEAIRYLVQYVAVSIALAARTLDTELMYSLPPLLAPFTTLSPLVHAMWQNAIASFEMNVGARSERAVERVTELYERLAEFTDEQLPYVSVIRNALAYAAGSIGAFLGQPSAVRWAGILERDPLQRVNAAHLRKLCCLQLGDARGAERYRLRAERLAAQASTLQMFSRPYRTELRAYVDAGDLTRVRECAEGLAQLAEQHPGWWPLQWLAQGEFHRLRGDHAAALACYARCAERCAPEASEPTRLITPWAPALAGTVATLLEDGQPAAAYVRATHALARGRAAGLDTALWDLERVAALALASIGEHTAAAEQLEDLAERQRKLGVAGLRIGSTYEARTRVAIWQRDAEAVAHYAEQTARAYRHGDGSALGGKYQRLLLEADAAGLAELPRLAGPTDDPPTGDSSTLKTRID